MTTDNTAAKKGLSLRVTHLLMIILAVMILALLIFSASRSASVFSQLDKATGNYIVRQKAAHDLMEASDYLTEMVQRFTRDGNMEYLDKYFEKAFVSRRREVAVTAMSESEAEQVIVDQIQAALDESLSLMYREYYAMKLVIDAKEYREYPETLRAIELKEEDELLEPEAKMELARDMVMGSEYYARKEIIRNDMKAGLESLDKLMSTTRRDTSAELNRELSTLRIIVVILFVLILAVIGLSAWLGTIPMVRAMRESTEGKPLTVSGSKEFRYLATKFNEMHEALNKEPKDKES